MAGLLASRASVLHGGPERRPPRRALAVAAARRYGRWSAHSSSKKPCSAPQNAQGTFSPSRTHTTLGSSARNRLRCSAHQQRRISCRQPGRTLSSARARPGVDGVRLMRARSHLIRPVLGNWKARPAAVRPDELPFVLRRGARPKRPSGERGAVSSKCLGGDDASAERRSPAAGWPSHRKPPNLAPWWTGTTSWTWKSCRRVVHLYEGRAARDAVRIARLRASLHEYIRGGVTCPACAGLLRDRQVPADSDSSSATPMTGGRAARTA